MIPTTEMLPDPDGASRPHWDGARRGEVIVQQCADCATLRHPFSPICAACGSHGHAWRAIRPTGTILSWCRFHRSYFAGMKEQLPYTVLLVEMDDGVRLFSNPMVDEPAATPVIGTRVRAVFQPISDGATLIRFEAIESTGSGGTNDRPAHA